MKVGRKQVKVGQKWLKDALVVCQFGVQAVQSSSTSLVFVDKSNLKVEL